MSGVGTGPGEWRGRVFQQTLVNACSQQPSIPTLREDAHEAPVPEGLSGLHLVLRHCTDVAGEGRGTSLASLSVPRKRTGFPCTVSLSFRGARNLETAKIPRCTAHT